MIGINLPATSFTDPLANGISRVLPKIPLAIGALVFGIIIIRILSWIAHVIVGLVRLPRGLKGILVSLIDGALWVFLFIAILQLMGLNNVALAFSGLVASLGLALAFGASTLTSDVLGGIFLAKDRDFAVGDEVIAGDDTKGVIESMDMRRTRIRDSADHLHVIPNSVVERKEWVLLSRRADRKPK